MCHQLWNEQSLRNCPWESAWSRPGQQHLLSSHWIAVLPGWLQSNIFLSSSHHPPFLVQISVCVQPREKHLLEFYKNKRQPATELVRNFLQGGKLYKSCHRALSSCVRGIDLLSYKARAWAGELATAPSILKQPQVLKKCYGKSYGLHWGSCTYPVLKEGYHSPLSSLLVLSSNQARGVTSASPFASQRRGLGGMLARLGLKANSSSSHSLSTTSLLTRTEWKWHPGHLICLLVVFIC